MTTQTLVRTLPFSVILPRINWRILALLCFFALFLFSIMYIFQINDLMNKTYTIQSYQKTISELSRENQGLQDNFSQIGYLENIRQKSKELSFQEVQGIKYIQITDKFIAKK